MPNPFSNKKKIRGWKKQVRKIEFWKNSNIGLNTHAIETGHNRDYLKIWIDPWYRLVKRNPPLWYNRLVLDYMVEIYMKWYDSLSKFDESFDLMIWLYEPNFINSQVVWAYGDTRGFYDNTFEKSGEDKEFPYEKYKLARYDLRSFSWELREEYDLQFKVLNDLSDDDIEKLVKRGYICEKLTSDIVNDIVYKKRTNLVWVGRLKVD